MAITVDYKILAKGYEISGDVRSGYHATVPYLVAWSDAFTFADEVLGAAQARSVGAITWRLPYRFPVAAANLYAQRFRIQPVGANGEIATLPYGGLAPGEYFTHAMITVEFGTPEEVQQQSQDDPQALHQLDPNNPITMCEQSVRAGAKTETRKAGSYIYDDDSKPVTGDFGVPISETKLVLKFPRVPFLPWQLVRPYINKVNSVEMLGVGVEELLLEDMDTVVQPGPDGLQQMLQLTFAVSLAPLVTWNHLPKPDGTNIKVRVKADAGVGTPRRIYALADFRDIFNAISYVES
jgi:hypothetical protein